MPSKYEYKFQVLGETTDAKSILPVGVLPVNNLTLISDSPEPSCVTVMTVHTDVHRNLLLCYNKLLLLRM